MQTNSPDDEGWIFEHQPSEPGWYAIAYCWEPMEGTFFGSDYWDGTTWGDRRPVVGFHGPFDNEDDANAWADKHAYE